MAGAEALEAVDVEAGGLRLGPPEVDEPLPQLRLVDEVGAVEVQLDVGDRHRAQLREVDHVAAELAVEHHHHRSRLAGHPADEPVANHRQAVVGGGLPPDPVTEAERHGRPVTSATTASESSGHRRIASTDQSSNDRSVRATSAHPAAGSTHIIVPAPPK